MRWWIVIFGLAFALVGIAAFVNLAEVPPETFVPLIPPAVSVTFTLAIFIGFMVTLIRLLRLAWAKIPTVVIDSANTNRVLATLISLGIFPAVATYAWSTFQSLMKLFPEFIRTLSAFDLQRECSGAWGAESTRRCASGLASEFGRIASQLASRTMEALYLEGFPLGDFVWFLMSTVFLIQLIAILRERLVLVDVVSWLTTSVAWIGSSITSIPTVTWQRIVFTTLVVTSFYLGLTALLAIPLLNEKSRSQHTVDDVAKALEVYLVKIDTLPAQLPQLILPASISADRSSAPQIETSSTQSLIKTLSETNIAPMVQRLQERWDRIRTVAEDTQKKGIVTAKNLFASALDGNYGKQHTDRYYYDILKWFSDTTIALQTSLSQCHDGASKLIGDSSQTLGRLKSNLELHSDELFRGFEADSRRLYDTQREVLYDNCAWPNLPQTPDSPTIASGLGTIGRWTSWLIDTERMPAVIIVGLVGFSLLGATVSRAVREKDDDRPRAAFTLDDLLTVIAGGTTAAVVVFLAAYGGLALLGNSTGDPNAYIVFATCLIAAVYSEDVWTWARRRLLDSELHSGNRQRHSQPGPRARTGTSSKPVTNLSQSPGR